MLDMRNLVLPYPESQKITEAFLQKRITTDDIAILHRGFCVDLTLKLEHLIGPNIGATVQVSQKSHVGMIVGRSGQNIMRVRRDINCDVQNPSPNEVPIFSLTSDNIVDLFLMAAWILKEDDRLCGRSPVNGNKREMKILCCPNLVGLLVGSDGSTIKQLKDQVGCAIQSPPRDNSTIKIFSVTGTEEQTEEVFLRMQSFLDKCYFDPPLYKPMKACECSLRGRSCYQLDKRYENPETLHRPVGGGQRYLAPFTSSPSSSLTSPPYIKSLNRAFMLSKNGFSCSSGSTPMTTPATATKPTTTPFRMFPELVQPPPSSTTTTTTTSAVSPVIQHTPYGGLNQLYQLNTLLHSFGMQNNSAQDSAGRVHNSNTPIELLMNCLNINDVTSLLGTPTKSLDREMDLKQDIHQERLVQSIVENIFKDN